MDILNESYDLLLTDVIEEPNPENKVAISVREDIARALNVEYLSRSACNNSKSTLPIKGAICSINSRCFFNLVCKYKEHPAINVIFLYDSSNIHIY